MAEPEWVTIAEGARRLGVRPRQARRWAAQLAPEARDTGKGQSPLRVLFSALERHASESKTARDTGKDSPQDIGENVPVALMAATYERVIREQAERIADLQSALEHERAQAQHIAHSLAREQTLRLLDQPRPWWQRIFRR